MPRLAFWASAVLAALAVPAAADPPSPLDLVRGLRENGMPDLAAEYLDEIEKRNPPPELKTVLPLERAKARLALAQLETDEAARDAAVAAAKVEFDAFLKAHAKHPRAPEASVALARVLSVQAKAALNKAFRADEAARKPAAAATRPLFRRAADLYAGASKQLDAAAANAAADAARAELDRGINQYNLADTYIQPTGTEVDERAAALTAARQTFADLGAREPATETTWVARAWAAACDLEMSEKGRAEEAFKLIRADGAKTPAGQAGVRMVDFFDAQAKYAEALAANQLAPLRAARLQAKAWLDKDKYRPRMTPERLSMSYYHAVLTHREGTAGVQYEKPVGAPKGPAAEAAAPKIRGIPGPSRVLLEEANRGYKVLTETDNEYADRAARGRAQVVRLLIGNADRPAAEYTKFEECQMAALVHLNEPGGAAKAIELLERCRQLADAATPARDKAEAQHQLAFAYYQGGRPADAAAAADELARTTRGSTAAKAGVLGIEAYLAARNKLPEGEEAARDAQRDKAVALGEHLEKSFPADPSTDTVRLRLGQLYLEDDKPRPAFDVLGRVSGSFPAVASARTLQGRAAYQLINDKESPLTPQDKAAVFAKATADAEAVPEPTGAAELKAYFGLRTLLAQLHLSSLRAEGYRKAEQIAADAGKRAAAAKTLDEVDRQAAAFSAEEVRLRAIYAQAVPLYRDAKYKELADRLTPALAEVEKAGPAAAAKPQGEAAVAADRLDKFRQDVVVLALQGRIREGAADQATPLFDMLDKLGGSAEATTDALNRLVILVRPQIDDLRKEGKPEDADKLTQTVGGLILRQAAKPKLPPLVVAHLGRALRALGAYDKAVEVLAAVPPPQPDDLKVARDKIDDPDRKELVRVHAIGQLELARAHRGLKQFDKADAVLTAALGADRRTGWARGYLEYRREAVLLLEDKAEAATSDPRERNKLWTDARAGWTAIARDYAAVITAKLDADEQKRTKQIQDKEKLIPVYLGLLADEKRCLARMVTAVLKDDPKKLASNLGNIAQQIVDVEKSNGKNLNDPVKAAFAAVLADYPQLKAEYEARGGKAFLPGG